MSELARTFERAMMKQILIDGFFHADPHPGNLFISPQTGVITFLDLGLIGELRTDQRLDLIDLMFSAATGRRLQCRAGDPPAERPDATDERSRLCHRGRADPEPGVEVRRRLVVRRDDEQGHGRAAVTAACG